jgi:hypothetical protein
LCYFILPELTLISIIKKIESVKGVECKPNKVYDFYADIKVHIEDRGVIMKVGVPSKADCYMKA